MSLEYQLLMVEYKPILRGNKMACYADLKPGDIFILDDSVRPRVGVRTSFLDIPIIWVEEGDVEPRANTALTILGQSQIGTVPIIDWLMK